MSSRNIVLASLIILTADTLHAAAQNRHATDKRLDIAMQNKDFDAMNDLLER